MTDDTQAQIDRLQEIADERQRQLAKWGIQRWNWSEWVSILGEEFGEAATDANKARWAKDEETAERHVRQLRVELIQTAAVCVQIIEHIDEVLGLHAPTPPAPALDAAHYPPHGIRTEADPLAWMDARGALAHVRPDTPSEDLIAEARGVVTAPDEAEKWVMVAEAIEESLFDVDGFIGAGPATAQAAVAKAIALELAAPADRAVCEITDLLVNECLDAMSIASESAIRTVLSIAAAHWRGAEAGEEGGDA